MLMHMILNGIRNKTPIVTICLFFNILVTTIPQFFLGEGYSIITGAPVATGYGWCLTTIFFSHSPEIILPHFLGNLLVVLFLGLLLEVVIGSNDYAFLVIVSFICSFLMIFSKGVVNSHGASGLIWSTHTVVIYIVYILARKFGIGKIIKDPFVLFTCLLIAFDIIGINLVEVFILKKKLFENYGQVIHLVLLILPIPYIYFKKRFVMEKTFSLYLSKASTSEKKSKRAYVFIFLFLIAINIISTVYLIGKVKTLPEITYTVEPRAKDIESIGKEINLIFDQKMIINNESVSKRSISAIDSELNLIGKWTSPHVFNIALSRQPTRGDEIHITYNFASQDGQVITISLDYK